jgi:hypothetical protein
VGMNGAGIRGYAGIPAGMVLQQKQAKKVIKNENNIHPVRLN